MNRLPIDPNVAAAEAAEDFAKAMRASTGKSPSVVNTSGGVNPVAKLAVKATVGTGDSDASARAKKILDPDIVVVPELPSHGGGSGGNNNVSGNGGSGSGNSHSSGGSSGGEPPTQPIWSRVISALIGVLLAVGTVYYYTHDTPPARAANEAKWLDTQAEEQKTAQAKEVTKQMKIAAESGSQVSMPGSLQNSSPRRDANQQFTAIDVSSEGQHFLSADKQFNFSDQGESSPSAIIAFRQPPKSKNGAFKFLAGGKTAWSETWSQDPSPYPLDQLLEESKSTEGNVKWIQLHSKGKSVFNM